MSGDYKNDSSFQQQGHSSIYVCAAPSERVQKLNTTHRSAAGARIWMGKAIRDHVKLTLIDFFFSWLQCSSIKIAFSSYRGKSFWSSGLKSKTYNSSIVLCVTYI